MRLPVTLQDEALVNDNDELRVQNEELASQNSALLAENLRLNRRLAELEQNHANGRPNLRYIWAGRGINSKSGIHELENLI